MRWSSVLPLVATTLEAAAGGADTFDHFFEWLRRRGVVLDVGLRIGTDKATGLRSILLADGEHEVAVGQRLFHVPLSTTFNAEHAQEQGEAWQRCTPSPAGKQFLAPEQTALALFLLEQREPGREWEPWIATMPTSFEGLPPQFGTQSLEEMQASPVRRVIERERAELALDHKKAAVLRPGLSLEEFRWARGIVRSRQFTVQHKTNGRLDREAHLMVPLLDFVNHPPDGFNQSNVRPTYDAAEGVAFIATRPIRPGEGLYAGYGVRSNRELLLGWGIALRYLTSSTDMPLALRASDLLGPPGRARYTRLQLLLSQAGDPDGMVRLDLKATFVGPQAERLFGLARFAAFESSDVGLAQSLCDAAFCPPLSADNERKALRWIIDLLGRLAAGYTTSHEVDKDLLEGAHSPALQGMRLNALIVRRGEKWLLEAFGGLLRIVEPLLGLSPEALANEADHNLGPEGARPHWSGLDAYVRRNVTDLVRSAAWRQT